MADEEQWHVKVYEDPFTNSRSLPVVTVTVAVC